LTRNNNGYILNIDSIYKGRAIEQNYKDNKIMPRLDKTGPLGNGSGTGWGMGPCCGSGMSSRRGFGQGYGFRRFYTKKEETEILREEANSLEEELKAIKERLSEIKDQK